MDINKYNEEELLELKNKIELRLLELNKQINPETIEFYTIITDFLNKNNFGSYPNLYILLKTNVKLVTKIKKAQRELDLFLKSINKEYTKKHRILLYHLFIKLLVNDMKEKNWCQVTLETLINNVPTFKSLFESNFPGYIESGLIYFIFKER